MKKMKSNKHIVLFAVLSLLLVSCNNNELPDDELSGQLVPVRIHSLGIVERGSENLARSSSQNEPEPVLTPIGTGMLVEMSIERDESPLRDKVLLEDGKKFRVIAVNHGLNTYYSHGDFIVGESGPSNDFHVEIGKSYDYICISYNSETDLPDDDYEVGKVPDKVDINNANDILWCRINNAQNVPASPGVVELDILLAQKLAKVSVIVDCNYNKWKISIGEDMVSIGDVATSGKLNLSSGDITSDTPAPQTFVSFTSDDDASTSQTSNELRIMPKTNGPITITVLAAAVSREDLSNIPTADRTTTLTTPLEAGNNYVITVRLRVPIFARSNIYWDDGTSYNPQRLPKLTFVPADGTIDNQGFQGVFFKWGSLVGVSPAQVNGQDDGVNNFIPVYKPTYNSDAPTSSTWAMTSSLYTDIFYLDMSTSHVESDYGRHNTYVIDAAQNTDARYTDLLGDICQYLGKTQPALNDYRLPTSYEFGPATVSSWTTETANADGWQKGTGSFSKNTAAGKADGTANLLVASGNNGNTVYGSGINKTMNDVVFPASGNRYYTTGMLDNVGLRGYYWSSSAFSLQLGYMLYLFESDVYQKEATYSSFAFPIRCVKKVDPTGSY
jgi:hypothetical protein